MLYHQGVSASQAVTAAILGKERAIACEGHATREYANVHIWNDSTGSAHIPGATVTPSRHHI